MGRTIYVTPIKIKYFFEDFKKDSYCLGIRFESLTLFCKGLTIYLVKIPCPIVCDLLTMELTDRFNLLAAIFCEQLSLPRENITLNTRLREDLKIDGDEVDELLCKIAEHFEIDWHGFNFYRYFHEEPHLFSLIYQCYYHKRHGVLKTITVNHLLSVIERGVWFEPL